MTLIVIVVVAIALFGLAFVTKRRFGVLGLALAAGVVLAQSATNYVSKFIEQQGVSVAPLSYDGTATILLILLPALILLIGGPTYTSKKSALIGALGFALLGTFFLLGPLTTALPTTDAVVRDVLVVVAQSQDIIVIVALVLALLDTVMVHGGLSRHRKSKH
ncbi:MAG: hypothetical protein ABIQ64_04555 [Candidatus Saccharimonadales bacterium]